MATSSKGYTQEEIEKFRKIFRIMPSYEKSIAAKELLHYLDAINYPTPTGAQQYVEYGDKVLGGRWPLHLTMNYLSKTHDTILLIKEWFRTLDLNNDGFISREEFEFGMKSMEVHDPKLKNLSYEKFMIEADTDNDGRISVAECEEWVDKNYK